MNRIGRFEIRFSGQTCSFQSERFINLVFSQPWPLEHTLQRCDLFWCQWCRKWNAFWPDDFHDRIRGRTDNRATGLGMFENIDANVPPRPFARSVDETDENARIPIQTWNNVSHREDAPSTRREWPLLLRHRSR